MATLELSSLTREQRNLGLWAASLLVGLARDEAVGRRPQRLTEPKLDTWQRFRGRLTSTDLVALLFEDASIIHQIPFDHSVIDPTFRLDHLGETLTSQWLKSIASLELRSPTVEYVAEQAKILGVPSRLARSELHVVKPYHKVLELPGTGGQLAHHLMTNQRDVTLQDNFTIACATWNELTLAGLVALDLGAPHTDFINKVVVTELRNPEHPLRQRSFDFVIGLHPDKGGLFQISDQLALWFPNAKILLV